MSTFVEVMQRKLWPLFPDTVYVQYNLYICMYKLQMHAFFLID